MCENPTKLFCSFPRRNRPEGGAKEGLSYRTFWFRGCFPLSQIQINSTCNLVNCWGIRRTCAPTVVFVIQPWPGPAIGVFSPGGTDPGPVGGRKAHSKEAQNPRSRSADKNTPKGQSIKRYFCNYFSFRINTVNATK